VKNQTTNDRIKHLISFKQLSISSFSREIGLINGVTISKIINEKRKPSSKTIGRIIKAFPDINYDWLITGQGDMLKGKETSSNNVIEQDEMTVTALQVTKYLYDRYPESSKSVGDKMTELIDSNHLHVLDYLHNGKNEIRDEIKQGFNILKIDTEKIRIKSQENTRFFSTLHNNTLNKVSELQSQINILNKKMNGIDIILKTIETHELIEKENLKEFLNPKKL
tara:strand:- start:375 stop:1043 length:669 start_codon:yes stop_codon:yes gene_type:complete